ncbi:protocatechuate 3,4-dioxygenase [Rhizobium sp. MC63]|uniref:Protocatechuate 3,4-dioxygenase n=1 Tax=Rhizobium mulingense TaxID=3031128 RepID=A0ACC6MTZ9_9HYPH|nr:MULTISPECIES: protocatechuate 3,4-dioxygenase [unclassified Rhizobium]MDF0697183.1 protocatechuate 3,4-dioxygenase [Rhizobium sp. MC63]MEA3516849.1 protocatechuate 3,4-dioxygenase [Rhizobium sp. MJ31]MEB3042543.1 protocatechuate 3,4-dioxygenase [Rhizobium sp. MJ21]
MKRRTLMLGGATIVASLVAAAAFWPRRQIVVAARTFDWKGTDFLSGGTRSVALEKLPAPLFRTRPNCVATNAQTLGPCHVNDIPARQDVTEGKAGLPLRLAVRIVHAADCRPVENADIEIWHTDHRGIYSGREAANMCTLDDAAAISGLAFRGRQLTDAAGQASFLTVYPGWYKGRTPHVHCRILAEGRELLVSQIYFDDALSDIVYGGHPDYRRRPPRDTRNDQDGLIPQDAVDHIFDFEKLDGGVLSATITIGLSS